MPSAVPSSTRIETVGLGKTYPGVVALAGVSLRVTEATVLAVLGHNGAGKSTLIDILATRARPTTGTATVCGLDVCRHPRQVRRRIAMTGQYVSLDDSLSAQGNLVLIARLLGASAKQAKVRARNLVEAFELTGAAQRPARGYSGGMRRRLDLAACLVGSPDVLFLDEPTTGLDPVSRSALWEFLKDLVSSGTTVVLTTQYLEEADRLADQVVVLAGGRVVATGSPTALKGRVGARTATMMFRNEFSAQWAATVLRRLGPPSLVDQRGASLTASVAYADQVMAMVRVVDRSGLDIADLRVAAPSMNDVYMALHDAGWSGQ